MTDDRKGRPVDLTELIHPDKPVTFRDLIPAHVFASGYPSVQHEIKHFTRAEIAELPVSRHFGPPDGWEKTGYLLPQSLIDTERYVVFTYIEFVRMIPGGSYESKTYVPYINGLPLIERRGSYE